MLREIAVLTQLEAHPAIVHLLDAYETDENFYLVLELCSGGELFEAITKQVSRQALLKQDFSACCSLITHDVHWKRRALCNKFISASEIEYFSSALDEHLPRCCMRAELKQLAAR